MEMIVNPMIFDSAIKYSDEEKIDVNAVKEAAEKTNVMFNNITRAMNNKKKYPINIIHEIEEGTLGGSLVTKSLTKFIEQNQPILMANPIEGNYPDMISRTNPLTGVEIKSKWLGGSSFSVNTTRKYINNVLVFGWDFINTIPQIVIVFFCNTLEDGDVKIYEGKSETTSKRPQGAVTSAGLSKIKDGWLLYHPFYEFPNRW